MTVENLWVMCANWTKNTKIKVYQTLADFLIRKEIAGVYTKEDIPEKVWSAQLEIFLIEQKTIHLILEQEE